MTDAPPPTPRDAKRLICRLLAGGCVIVILLQLTLYNRLDSDAHQPRQVLAAFILITVTVMLTLLAAYPRRPQ